MYQLFLGLFTEGTTDNRFLKSIVERTLHEVAYDSNRDIEIYVYVLEKGDAGQRFPQQILNISKKGVEDYGIQVLCIHRDADAATDTDTFTNIINPAVEELEQTNDDYCKIVVPIVPIQETESWMMADKSLLKQQIGTIKTDSELNLDKFPEKVSNPKEVIEQAIVTTLQHRTKRRRRDLTISQLYQPIGQQVSLEDLRRLSSFQKFEKSIRAAFVELNLLKG
jgi:hypothetical protein